MKFDDSLGCSVIRGTTGRMTNHLNSSAAAEERLIIDWASKGDCSHSGADRFRHLISGLSVDGPEFLLFRGRFRSEDMWSVPNAEHFGPPSKEKVKAGRYNKHGQPVLYLSTSENGVLREMCSERPPIDLYCQKYQIPRGMLRIADFSSPDLANFVHIAFDYAEHGLGSGGINNREYAFSQVLAEIVESAGYEGMMVPGVRGTPDARYLNIVLFSTESWEEWLVGEPFLLS